MNESLPTGIRLKRTAIRLTRTLRNVLAGDGTVYVSERVNEYRGYWEEAARLLSADFETLTGEVWEVRRGGRRARLCNHMVEIDNLVTLMLAGDKSYCYQLARNAGLPVPDHQVFSLRSLDRAGDFMRAHPGELVVKPARGSSSGLGVTTHIRDRRGLERAACLASLFCDELLIETMVFGESCRLLFLDGELLHGVRRRGVRVVGDGTTTLRRLLEQKKIGGTATDATSKRTLASQGLSLDDVPEKGLEVLTRSLPGGVRRSRELRTVYDEAITSRIGPELREAAADLVAALGSRFAGVDVIARDPTLPLEQSGAAFIELNTTPGIHHHYVDDDPDRRVPVAVRVLEYLLTHERVADAVPTRPAGDHARSRT